MAALVSQPMFRLQGYKHTQMSVSTLATRFYGGLRGSAGFYGERNLKHEMCGQNPMRGQNRFLTGS
jgi:hypothetical protein